MVHSFFVEQHCHDSKKVRKKTKVNISATKQYGKKIINDFLNERTLNVFKVTEHYGGEILPDGFYACSRYDEYQKTDGTDTNTDSNP